MANGKQMTAKLVGLVLALVIGAILIGNVMPIGINAVSEDVTSSNTTTAVGNTDAFANNRINVTIDSAASGTPDTATITVEDTINGDSKQKTVDESTSATFGLTGGDVNVSVSDVNTSPSPSEVTYQISYPNEFGWNDSTKGIWQLLPIFLILAALVLLAGITLRQM